MRAFYLPRGLELTLAPVDVNQHVLEVIDLTRARWSNMPQERGVVVSVETHLRRICRRSSAPRTSCATR